MQEEFNILEMQYQIYKFLYLHPMSKKKNTFKKKIKKQIFCQFKIFQSKFKNKNEIRIKN